MRALRFALFAGLLAACSSTNSDSHLPESPDAEIPIRRVVLYQNGVGYFEREGRVEGDRLTLSIRPSQINDLLKSLTVIDRGKGRAVSISLPLEKSGDRILAELPDQVRHANGLLDVLAVFRGARVELDGRQGSVTGRVLGVENLETKRGEDVVPDWRVTVRSEDGDLRVYPIRDITAVSILDRTLAIGLEQSLDVSLSEGDWKPITLSIQLAGESKTHDLRASYIVEMPRWKPAYRLVLGEDRPLLQGWAVVDNVSGEDWSNVRLSLVAGAPLSFIYDLHSSQYTGRVDMSPKGRQIAAAPPVEQGGVAPAEPEHEYAAEESMDEDYAPASEAVGSGAGRGAGMAQSKMMAKPAPPPAAPMMARDMGESLETQAAPTVEVKQMGALFRYDIADAVTVPDRSSTLVAIINQRITAEEVVFFRPGEDGSLETHPYRSVKFTNDSALTLEKGPVTLYSGGTFVGEGFVDQVQPGSTHFISYSIDGRVSLESDVDVDEQQAHLLRISGGQILSESQSTVRTKYTIDNLNDKPIKAFLKEERRPDWELQSPPPGIVETPTHFMIPAQVPAKKSAVLEVAWTSKTRRTVGLDTSSGISLLRMVVRGGKVPPQAQAAVDKVLGIVDQLERTRSESVRLRKLHDQLSADQDRVRANLNTLRKTTGNQGLQAKLAQKLSAQEEELGKLSGQLVELSEKEAELQAELTEAIKAVSFEPTGSKR